MGKSQTIAQMEAKEDEYRAYLAKLEKELEDRASEYNEEMQKNINDFYMDNNWDKQNFISGKNADFMQQSDWSLKNVKTIIDAIAMAVFGDTQAPEGVTIEKAEDVGKAISEMEHWEVYIAGKCFEALGGIVETFGSASTVAFNSGYKSEALGNGIHLFATVVCDSYKSQDFFSGEEIYEYLYIYEVKYSIDEAVQQQKMELTGLYEDQIVTYKNKVEELLTKLEDDAISPQQYQDQTEIYNTLIEKAEEQLKQLKEKELEQGVAAM